MIDGVEAASKLSKGVVLAKATEYIRFLRKRRDLLDGQLNLFRNFLKEGVVGGEEVLEELEARWNLTAVEMEARWVREETEAELMMMEPKPKARKRAAAPAPKKGAAKRKVESEEEEDDDEEMSEEETGLPTIAITQPEFVYPPASTSAASTSTAIPHHYFNGFTFGTGPSISQDYNLPPSPPTSHSSAGPSPPSVQAPSRPLLAVFAGVSFLGGVGYDWSYNAASSAGASSNRSWPLFSKRASVPLSQIPAWDVPVNPMLITGFVFLSLASLMGWLTYLLWPIFVKPVAHQRALEHRQRAAAIASLGANTTENVSDEMELTRRTRKAREALLVIANCPTTFLGAVLGLLSEGFLSYLGLTSGFGKISEEEKLERAVALVRLAEIETAHGEQSICLVASAID